MIAIGAFHFSFGFVEFPTPEAAEAAYNSMQGESVDGREICVDYAAERREGAFSSIFYEL